MVLISNKEHTLEELLIKGIKQGYFRPEIDVKILAKMRISQVELGFDNDIYPVPEFNIERIQQQFSEHFNYGIFVYQTTLPAIMAGRGGGVSHNGKAT